VSFSIDLDHRIEDLAANHAPPSIKTQWSRSLPYVLKCFLDHESPATRTIHVSSSQARKLSLLPTHRQANRGPEGCRGNHVQRLDEQSPAELIEEQDVRNRGEGRPEAPAFYARNLGGNTLSIIGQPVHGTCKCMDGQMGKFPTMQRAQYLYGPLLRARRWRLAVPLRYGLPYRFGRLEWSSVR
jgi:hypothetical protein